MFFCTITGRETTIQDSVRIDTMTENASENVENPDSATRGMSAHEIQRSLEAEIREMEKYKWYLGEKLQHDPLQDRSLNDIYCEWIDKYASDFRRDWEKKEPQ
jgi:hypothetical protein